MRQDPQDSYDFAYIPDWVRNHPEIRARGIELELPLKPFVAWQNIAEPPEPQYVVKILKPGSEEANIYDRLHKLNPASPNHTLPCDVIRSERPILILPWVRNYASHFPCETPFQFVRSLLQILEGLDFLHSHHIAHYDMSPENVVIARKSEIAMHQGQGLEKNKIYIIDFGESRQFELGPGQQPAVQIHLQHNYLPPQGGRPMIDPYSWDIYCFGRSLGPMIESRECRPRDIWLLHWYARWLRGHEPWECTGICRCRPTARRAYQVLKGIYGIVHVWELCKRVMAAIYGPFSAATVD